MSLVGLTIVVSVGKNCYYWTQNDTTRPPITIAKPQDKLLETNKFSTRNSSQPGGHNNRSFHMIDALGGIFQRELKGSIRGPWERMRGRKHAAQSTTLTTETIRGFPRLLDADVGKQALFSSLPSLSI